MRKSTKLLIRGIFAVVGGFIISLASAINNSLGVISPYLVSYFRLKDPLVTNNSAIMIPVLASLVVIPILFVSNIIARLIGFKMTLGFACLGLGATFFFVSFVETWSMLLLFLAIFAGIFTGFCVVLQVYPALSYFPKYKGVVSGIILSGLSLSPLFIGNLFIHLINPDNVSPSIVVQNGNTIQKYFDETVVGHLPYCLRVFAIIDTVVMLIGVILIQEPVTKADLIKMNSESTLMLAEHLPREKKISLQIFASVKSELCTMNLWLLFFSICFGVQFISYVQYEFKFFGYSIYDFGSIDYVLSAIGMVSYIGGIAGKIIQGIMFDKLGPKPPMIFTFIATALLAFFYCPLSEKSLIWFSVMTVAVVFMYGMLFGIMPMLSNYYYGQTRGPIVFGIFFFAYALGTTGMDIVTSILQPKLGYWKLQSIFGGISLLGLVLFILKNDKQIFERRTTQTIWLRNSTQNSEKQERNSKRLSKTTASNQVVPTEENPEIVYCYSVDPEGNDVHEEQVEKQERDSKQFVMTEGDLGSLNT